MNCVEYFKAIFNAFCLLAALSLLSAQIAKGQAAIKPPTNPLVRINPLNGSGNEASLYNNDGTLKKPVYAPPNNFGDFSPYPGDPRIISKPTDLPLFGYDFFAPAREYILARRAYLEKNYPYLFQIRTGIPLTPTQKETASTPVNLLTPLQISELTPIQISELTPQQLSAFAPAQLEAFSASQRAALSKEQISFMTPQQQAALQQPQLNSSTANVTTYPLNNDFSNTDQRRIETNSTAQPKTINSFTQIASPLEQMVSNVSASVPATYQLSGGDQLDIRYSNPAMESKAITIQVTPQGMLNLGKDGEVNVAGLTLEQARIILQRHLARYYKNPEVSITLKELRTIQVTVMGNVFAPGTYSVPATSTAFNMLYAAGGPTRIGSLRDIEIRRHSGSLHFDLYRLMAALPNGKKQAEQYDIPLQSGDVLYVPGYAEHVYVMGEVRNPAEYELKSNETLSDALKYAGGVKASGVAHSVQVITYNPGQERVIKTVNIDSPGALNIPLYNSDIVNIMQVRPVISNVVQAEGAVVQPGDYSYSPGMHVSNLIQDAQGLLNEAYLPHAALYRWKPNGIYTLIPINLDRALADNSSQNILLKRWDRLIVYTQQEAAFVGEKKVTLRGAVQRPGTYEYSSDTRLTDLLLKAGGPLPDASLVVDEERKGDGSRIYHYAPITELKESGSKLNIIVHDNDLIAVYTNAEAQYIPDHRVSILGKVTGPGEYDRGEGMTLTDLIKLAGGFLPDSGFHVTIAHARQISSTNSPKDVTVLFNQNRQCPPQDNILLQDGDVVTVDGRGMFQEHPLIAYLQGEVAHPGPYIITPTTRLSDLVKMAGGLTKEAFPDGTSFNRNPQLMTSSDQRQLARIINDLNAIYNQSDYQRQLAKSDIERIKATHQAEQAGSPLPISAASAAVPSAGPSGASAVLAGELAKDQLVSPPRVLSDSELKPSGNVAVDLPDALKHPDGPADLLIDDGDQITIPTTPTTVQVVGAVIHQRGVIYNSHYRLIDYINQSGGYAPDASVDHIVVIHPNGGLTPYYKVRSLQPGDLIYVPTKVMVAKISGSGFNAGNFFSALTGSALLFKIFGIF